MWATFEERQVMLSTGFDQKIMCTRKTLHKVKLWTSIFTYHHFIICYSEHSWITSVYNTNDFPTKYKWSSKFIILTSKHETHNAHCHKHPVNNRKYQITNSSYATTYTYHRILNFCPEKKCLRITFSKDSIR